MQTVETFNDNSIMPFGKHRGKAMANIPAVYLLYLNGCENIDARVKKYIINNLDALNKEASKIKR